MTRERAEALFGPIKTVCQCPPIPIRSLDWSAYFDRYLDVDCPSWVQASAATEEEAVAELLEQAADHFCEMLGKMRLADLDRLSGCNDL
jgi:hypothetical protein